MGRKTRRQKLNSQEKGRSLPPMKKPPIKREVKGRRIVLEGDDSREERPDE